MDEFKEDVAYAGEVLADADLADVIHYFVYQAEVHAEMLLG